MEIHYIKADRDLFLSVSLNRKLFLVVDSKEHEYKEGDLVVFQGYSDKLECFLGLHYQSSIVIVEQNQALKEGFSIIGLRTKTEHSKFLVVKICTACEGLGTDEESIIKIFNTIKRDSDLDNLIQEFDKLKLYWAANSKSYFINNTINLYELLAHDGLLKPVQQILIHNNVKPLYSTRIQKKRWWKRNNNCGLPQYSPEIN
nr:DUF3850 domain-containing protein [uncultured Fluviicola sp.]